MMVDPPREASMARESANAKGTRRSMTRGTSASARMCDSAIERVRDLRLSRAGCQDETLEIFRNAHGEARDLPVGDASRNRYGRETVVPSPVAEITNVPDEVLPAYAYGVVQPAGVAGIVAMNGPAVWP